MKHVHVRCLPLVDNNSVYLDISLWICPKCSDDIFAFNNLENHTDFMDAISDSWKTTLPPSIEELNRYDFNPFEVTNDESYLPYNDSDPDLQYFNDKTYVDLTSPSTHYNVDLFNKMCEQQKITNDFLSFIHI